MITRILITGRNSAVPRHAFAPFAEETTSPSSQPRENTMEDRLEYVALSDIVYNPAINARRDTETDVSELAATIDGQNLGQPLLLRPAGNHYEPVDGGRRLRAMKHLAEQGKLPADHPVPAFIRELSDAEAMSLSLATAITRLDLHPADEALSFTDLAAKGVTAEEMSARFGIPLRRVRQRLAIGQLPGEIIAALKADEIGLEDAQAFTLLRDASHAAKLWKQGVRQAWKIRQEFGKARVPADSADAEYVGRDAYVAAGGRIDEDLFSNNAWFADGKLLSKLLQKKLEADEAAWLSEGWSFVIFEMDKTHSHKTYGWPHLQPEGKPSLSKEEKARADELKAELKKLEAAWRKVEDGDEEDELADKIDATKAEIERLTGKFFTDAQKKKSGVVVRRGYQEIEVHFGMMKPAAAKKEAKLSKQTRDADDDDGAPSPVRKIEPEAEADFTAALEAEMAKAMTHAMQIAISRNPAKAQRLAASVLMIVAGFNGPQGFIIDAPRRDRASPGTCFDLVEELLEPAESRLSNVFTAAEQRTDLEKLVAISIARLLVIQPNLMAELRPLIAAFDPDVFEFWQPGEEFFKRMPRESLAAALSEACVPGATPSKKKKELVEMALRHLVPTGWLPKPLRTPSYKGPGNNAWTDAQAAAAAGITTPEEEAA